MKKYLLYSFSFITILIIAESCNSTSKLYSYDDKSRNYAGQLSEDNFIALKQFLITSTSSKLKDTIIIKYDYNNETCWNLLDQKDKAYIMGFVASHKERIETVVSKRQHVSVFEFREPGNNLNKLKKWDNSIIIDSTKQLFNLLFKERCTCGSSIIIMPDKRFIFLRSDSHLEVLDWTPKQIEEVLNKK